MVVDFDGDGDVDVVVVCACFASSSSPPPDPIHNAMITPNAIAHGIPIAYNLARDGANDTPVACLVIIGIGIGIGGTNGGGAVPTAIARGAIGSLGTSLTTFGTGGSCADIGSVTRNGVVGARDRSVATNAGASPGTRRSSTGVKRDVG